MVTSHSLAGRLVLSLGTRTCQPVLRGRQATAPSTPWWLGGGSHPSMWVRFGMVRQVGWTPECGLTEFELRFVPLLFMQRGVRYTSLVGCWHGSGCPSIVVPRPPWWLGGNEWVTGPSPPRLDVTTASISDPLLVSWLTVKVRVWVAMLRTDQTVGSSVTNARVVTVSGVIWTSFVCSHALGYVSHGGVGSLSTGSPSDRGSGRSTSA